jgi:hypothetical protein
MNINPFTNYEILPVGEDERVCKPTSEENMPYIMFFHAYLTVLRLGSPYSNFKWRF